MNSQRYKVLLYLKGFITTSIPKCYSLLQHCPSQSTFYLKYSTVTSGNRSFAVSYLVNNFGFSQEFALKLSSEVHIEILEKPDSVLSFFRNHGFSNPQIHNIITKAPWLLSCNPDRRILPKFRFLFSKGASPSDINRMVSASPKFLKGSLENQIIPLYELLKGIFQSDEATIVPIKSYPCLLFRNRYHNNVKLLRDCGLVDINIAKLIRRWPYIVFSNQLEKAMEEVNHLGFNPSKLSFAVALLAKTAVNKHKWNAKVDAFKKWGWSEQAVLEAFRKYPALMLSSTDKINAVMKFWVNQLGWDSLILVKGSDLIGQSLEKRLIPRASVLQLLLLKGLMTKNASLITPFKVNEREFLKKFVTCHKEESPQLLKLYVEKMRES